MALELLLLAQSSKLLVVLYGAVTSIRRHVSVWLSVVYRDSCQTLINGKDNAVSTKIGLAGELATRCDMIGL